MRAHPYESVARGYFECVLLGALRRRGRQVCTGHRIKFAWRGQGCWLVDLTGPVAHVAQVPPSHRPYDLALHLDLTEAEFCDFIDGNLDIRAAYAAGKVVPLGDIALLRRLGGLLSVSPRAAQRQRINPLQPRAVRGVRMRGVH